MIGMSAQNRHRPIKLLEQHNSYQLVRPCRGAERERKIRVFAHVRIEPVGTADDEADSRASGISPTAEAARKGLAAQRLPAAVEDDDDRVLRHRSFQGRTFHAPSLGRPSRPALVDLDHVHGLDANGAARLFGALTIALGKLALRPGLQSSDREDDEPHGTRPPGAVNWRGGAPFRRASTSLDRKSTRLNSSHPSI